LEPYVSKKANPVTDGWAATGMIRAGRSIVAAHNDGSDLAARTDMALAALMGGLALANAKLGAVHGFAAVIGGMSQAPHGAICAALLAPVCRTNLALATPPVARRFQDVARWLTGDPRATADDGIAWIEATRDALRIPGLAGFGLTAAAANDIAAKAGRASSTAGNPVALDQAALVEIYLSAL
jgi:alcohol dehydrogenase class IV